MNFNVLKTKALSKNQMRAIKDTMFVDVQNNRSSGRVVPPLAAGRSPTDD